MQKLIIAITLALASCSLAVDYEFVGGSTDKFILVNMYDTAGVAKTGLVYSAVTATYTRNTGTADVDITEATMTMGTHVDGGWIEVDATNSPGLYQFGLPDAAIADGAESVILSFKATSTFQRFIHISLIDVDLRSGPNVLANTVQIEGADATNQINAEADTALADYDPPTNAEMVARTVTSATYATATALGTAQGDITAILADTSAMDTSSELRTLLTGSNTAVATGTAQSTAQADLDILTGANGAILATTQANYAPATASALSSAQADISAILTDTAAVDTTGEMRTFLSGADTPLAKESSVATAQSDLDILTGTNGATLASSQPNYAPYTGTPPTVSQIRTELESSGTKLSLVLADTDELQMRFGLMIEADDADWRFDANALEQAPSGGGGGGDATEANQLAIIADLDEIKGVGFDTDDHSLSAIRARGDAAWGSGGSGSVPVNHNTGGTDALRFVDGSGAGIEGASVVAYVKEDYDDGIFTMRGQVATGADGRWTSNLMLDEDVPYTLVFYKPGAFGPTTANVTP